jgi:hypothetical protein
MDERLEIFGAMVEGAAMAICLFVAGCVAVRWIVWLVEQATRLHP